jgi:hypothetical protein
MQFHENTRSRKGLSKQKVADVDPKMALFNLVAEGLNPICVTAWKR